MGRIRFNEGVRLIISDVDETAAELYMDADPRLIRQFERLLAEGRAIFFISGQGVEGVFSRIVRHIRKGLRKRVLIGPCLGAEAWGFDAEGDLGKRPFYSLYREKMDGRQRKAWREAVGQIIDEFELKTFPTMPLEKFKRLVGDDPRSVMLADRGPQITIEVMNSGSLPGLRERIRARAGEIFRKAGLPVLPTYGGAFAIDFRMKGASKGTAVRYVMKNGRLLRKLGLGGGLRPESIEVWGDKFAEGGGGVDSEMSAALPKKVRSITFRREDPGRLPAGYNVVVWDGKEQFHDGLLEFLETRRR